MYQEKLDGARQEREQDQSSGPRQAADGTAADGTAVDAQSVNGGGGDDLEGGRVEGARVPGGAITLKAKPKRRAGQPSPGSSNRGLGSKARAGQTPLGLATETKRAFASAITTAATIVRQIDTEDGWAWARGEEIKGQVVSALNAAEEQVRQSQKFSDMVTGDLALMKKNSDQGTFDSDCETFAATMKPLVDKVQKEVATIMAQKAARQNVQNKSTGTKRRNA